MSTATAAASAVSNGNKKKIEEKTIKLLRDLASLSFNKQCCDCSQRGPTYVNVTMGTFVCTSCSGILRGLNPPHRVKSINMATFTPDEVDFIKSHGNHYSQLVYMSLFDSTTGVQPDSRDTEKAREFLTQKYEKKRWYSPPNDMVLNQIKAETDLLLNSSVTANAFNKNPNNRSQNYSNLNIQQQKVETKTQVKRDMNINTNNFISPNVPAKSQPNQLQQPSNGSEVLFPAFDNDFSATETNGHTTATNANASTNFANFDLFENFSHPSNEINTTSTGANQNHFSNSYNPFSELKIQPVQPIQNQQQLTSNPKATINQSNDKYLALAELDGIFGPVTSSISPTQVRSLPNTTTTTMTSISANLLATSNTSPLLEMSAMNITPKSSTMQPTPFAQAQFNAFPSTNANTQHQTNTNNIFNTCASSTQPFTVPTANYLPTNSFQSNPTNLFIQSTTSINTNNPFISIVQQQSLIQKPKAYSTNPFL